MPAELAETAPEGGPPPEAGLLRRALLLALGVLVLTFVAVAVAAQLGRLENVEVRLEPAWIALAGAGIAVTQLLHIEIWRRLLHELGEDLGGGPARAVWNVSNLARYVPTSALAPVMRAELTARHGVSRRVCLVSAVYEVALSILGAVLVSAAFVIRLPALGDEPLRWLVLLVVPAGMLALHPSVFHRATDAALRRLGREPLPTSLTLGRVAWWAVVYAGTFVIGGLALCALVEGLHGLGLDDVPTVLVSYALGYVLSVLGFLLPGGLGAREAGIAAGLTAVAPLSVAVAAAVVLRLLQLAVELAFAALFGLLGRRGDV